MSTIFERAQAIVSDAERVTQAHLRKVTLPGATFGLITLDNGEDHTKPNTFGPASLLALNTAIDAALADDDARVNPYGGAIAMGHPLASSGVRLMTQLARQFEERPEVRYGLTTMCIGIGMGGTVIWENPHWTGGDTNEGDTK